MDFYSKNKVLVASGVVAVSTLLLKTAYWLYRKYHKVELSTWLKDYIKEISLEIKGKQVIPAEGKLKLVDLFREFAEYLYESQNQELEEERRETIYDEKAYEELIIQTMDLHEKYHSETKRFFLKEFGVNIEQLQKEIQENQSREFKLLMSTCKKAYDTSELPKISNEMIKAAFIFYAEKLQSHSRIAQEQMILMNKNPEYAEMGMKIIVTNQYMLKDLIYNKYKIKEKYLMQLVKQNGLLSDSQVLYLYEDISRMKTGEFN